MESLREKLREVTAVSCMIRDATYRIRIDLFLGCTCVRLKENKQLGGRILSFADFTDCDCIFTPKSNKINPF